MSQLERIQKIIAQAGLASRREAEELISEGQVTVNGKTAKLGDKATLGEDAIKVKGKLIQRPETKVYYLLYKPKNMIAMINEDEEGRPTLKDLTRGIKERVFTIGRMDFSGEGAILLTNDGEMAQKITKSNEIIRRYHVKVDRHPTQDDLSRLARGGRIDGVSMIPHHIRVANEYSKNALIEISFQGSGVTEIKKFFENKGFFPEKVARVGIGHLKADSMKPGMIKKLDATSIEALFTQPELTTRLIEKMVKDTSKKKEATEEMSEKKISRRPPRGRPKPAERAAMKASRGDDSMPAPRFKSFGGERKSFGGERKSFGGERKSFGGERKSFGGERKSFGGERKSFGGERKSFGGERKSFGGERKSFGGERKSFGGERKSFGGERKSFGGERKSFGGERKSFGGERKSFGGERKSFGGERKSFGGERKSFGGERKSFGGERKSFGGERKSFGGERKSFGGERKSFGGERKSFGGERKSFGGERKSFGGERKSFGGERKSFGGERKSFGGERKSFGGERKSFGGERKSFGGERKSFGSRKPGFKPSFKRDF